MGTVESCISPSALKDNLVSSTKIGEDVFLKFPDAGALVLLMFTF